MTRPRSQGLLAVAGNGRTIVGTAPALLLALDTARSLARTQVPILITGETGTGKELLARYIHRESGRSPFMDVDCGALPDELAESLLFGHRRGAFTGAIEHSEGLIGLADGGTLFLDELASLPVRGQSKLLRAIESGAVRRVGSDRSRKVDFRLLSTAQDDVSIAVGNGRFRLDLLQRVAGAVVRMPSLAERPDDIVPLARHFAAEAGVSLAAEAERLMEGRTWRGNVRELRWTVLRAAALAGAGSVGRETMLHSLRIGPHQLLGAEGGFEPSRREKLRAICQAHSGSPDRVAKALGIGRTTLYRWLDEAGLDLASFRELAPRLASPTAGRSA